MRDAWGEGLVAFGAEYPELVVLDGDLANSTKADLFAAAHADRFYEMGIAGEGIAASVLHLPTWKPVDADAIVSLADRVGAIVIAVDHSIIGGLGSAVAETLGERRPTPLRPVGWRDVYGESGPNDALLEKYGLTAGHVAAVAREPLGSWR